LSSLDEGRRRCRIHGRLRRHYKGCHGRRHHVSTLARAAAVRAALQPWALAWRQEVLSTRAFMATATATATATGAMARVEAAGDCTSA
jgi:hypothetical protein